MDLFRNAKRLQCLRFAGTTPRYIHAYYRIYSRRLAVVMTRLKMAESVKEATMFIEQGHVRVGPDTITDPAYLITRFPI